MLEPTDLVAELFSSPGVLRECAPGLAVAEPVIRAAIPDANVPTSVRRSGLPVTCAAQPSRERHACTRCSPQRPRAWSSPRARRLTRALRPRPHRRGRSLCGDDAGHRAAHRAGVMSGQLGDEGAGGIPSFPTDRHGRFRMRCSARTPLYPARDRMPCLRAPGVLAGCLDAAGCLHDAPLHCKITRLETERIVVGVETDLLRLGEDPRVDPLVSPTPDHACRAGGVGDLDIRGAEHLGQLVEHDPIRMRSIDSRRIRRHHDYAGRVRALDRSTTDILSSPSSS